MLSVLSSLLADVLKLFRRETYVGGVGAVEGAKNANDSILDKSTSGANDGDNNVCCAIEFTTKL